MILVFVSMMLGTVMGQTSYPNSIGSHTSPSFFNIIDGHIPITLTTIKGCKRDLQISDVIPTSYVPISCADVRYSTHDNHTFTLSKEGVTVHRTYTDKLSEYVDGVCKIQVSQMPVRNDFGLYENGKKHVFLNRYGYCDDNTMKIPTMLPGISNVSISCGDEGKQHILTKTECSVTLGFEVQEIFDKTKPYGCVDGKFNSFDRSKDLEDVENEILTRMGQRVQFLLDEFNDIQSGLNTASIADVPEQYAYETSIGTELGSAYDILKKRLQNIREYIKSVQLKQAYYTTLVSYLTQQQDTISSARKNHTRAFEIEKILKRYISYNVDVDIPKLTNVTNDNYRLENKYTIIYEKAVSIKDNLNLINEQRESEIFIYGNASVDGIYDIYKNYMIEHYHRDTSTPTTMKAWCDSLAEHRELTRVIGCIPGLDFNVHCVPDEAHYVFVESSSVCRETITGGSISNCPVACDADRTANKVDEDYEHFVWNNPKSDQSAGTLLSAAEVAEKVGLIVNTTLENNALCPYNYICIRGFDIRRDKIQKTFYNYSSYRWDYTYEYGNMFQLQTSIMDYESVVRSMGCAPFCFANLPVLSVKGPSEVTFSLSPRIPTKRQTNIDIIFSDILKLEMSDSSHSLYDLYEELVEQNLSCELLGCQELCITPLYNSVEDAVLSCSEMCVLDTGFSQYWDDSPVRQASRIISNRQHECRCGSPKTELECVMSNNEWKSEIYTTQYTYVSRNPVKRKSVTYRNRYLFCPISPCNRGFVDANCGQTVHECGGGEMCSNVRADLSFKYSPNHGWHSMGTIQAYRLTSELFFFGAKYVFWNKPSGFEYAGVIADRTGNIVEQGFVTSTAPSNSEWTSLGERSVEMQHHFNYYDIPDTFVDLENFSYDINEACPKGSWYDGVCIAPGDIPFCNNGFVDEVCMCKDVSCEPGYYCTKTGECKPWVSKDKKVLHTRYKHLTSH